MVTFCAEAGGDCDESWFLVNSIFWQWAGLSCCRIPFNSISMRMWTHWTPWILHVKHSDENFWDCQKDCGQSKKFTVRNLRLPIPKCQWRSEWQNFSSWVWWGYDKWRHWVWNCKSPASVAYLISMQKWWWIRAWNSQLSILRFSTDCSLSKDCNTRSQQLMLIYNSL